MTDIESVAEAICQYEFKMPGAGGLRGSLFVAPAHARELAKVAIDAMKLQSPAEPFAGLPDRLHPTSNSVR